MKHEQLQGGLFVYLAGVDWDSVVGTDRRLATAIARLVPVLWVDPPISVVGRLRSGRRGQDASSFGIKRCADNVYRLRVSAPPGVTRPVVRDIAARLIDQAVGRAVARSRRRPVAIVLANPEGRFPLGVGGRRVYYVTDDWMTGAPMMGLSSSRVESMMLRNLATADVVAAVSPGLLDTVTASVESKTGKMVLANGCNPQTVRGPFSRPTDVPDGKLVGLVGQVNERLDWDVLEAVASTHLNLVVVGPRTERTPDSRARLDSLFGRPNVHWLGMRPPEAIPDYLRAFDVGLTPYADNAFNRSSFPLKTLEYLAAGLPVVATDLPSIRWMDTDLVEVGRTPDEFRRLVLRALQEPDGDAQVVQRQAFAARHTWSARAEQLIDAL